jgi:predicted nucleotidyltransferase
MEVPEKIILPLKKQNEILSKVKKIIKPISSSKPVIRILIEGSVARRELGKYVKPKHGIMPYSDVDVLVVAEDKIKLPKSFIEDYNLQRK